MNIEGDGKIIEFSEDELKVVINLVCKCGHKLSEHSFFTVSQLGSIYTDGCSECICSQFKVQK